MTFDTELQIDDELLPQTVKASNILNRISNEKMFRFKAKKVVQNIKKLLSDPRYYFH